jgi:hypothetical protein
VRDVAKGVTRRLHGLTAALLLVLAAVAHGEEASGVSPGGKDGPGGFVPRGSQRSFYAGAGGRLWYYLNHYYWLPKALLETHASDPLWIKADVTEQFVNLTCWPDGKAAPDSKPKTTVEYWAVGPSGRTIWLDNHKDYCLLEHQYTAGAINVELTLTIGRLEVRDERGEWGVPSKPYILEARNYRKDGIGAERTRFVPLRTAAVTVWGYRVPWDVHPQRLTRSNWQDLELPTWELREQRLPEPLPAPGPVVTPRAEDSKGE